VLDKCCSGVLMHVGLLLCSGWRQEGVCSGFQHGFHDARHVLHIRTCLLVCRRGTCGALCVVCLSLTLRLFAHHTLAVPLAVPCRFGSKLISDDREDALQSMTDAGCSAVPDFSVTCSPTYLASFSSTDVCATTCFNVVLPCLGGTDCFTGGQVVLVFFAVIIGAMAIGQATPSFSSAAQGQVAGHKIFEVVDRVVPIMRDTRTYARCVRWVVFVLCAAL